MAKKKGRRRRTGSPGATVEDPNAKRRERLEERRRQREQEIARARRVQQRERFVRLALIGAFLAAAAWFFFIRNQTPDQILGHSIETVSFAGSGQHTDATVDYPTVPPLSGEHAPNPAPCGIHGQMIPNEQFVHTLEHGAVAIVYRPDLPPEDIARIEAIVKDYEDHVVSAPNEELTDPPIAVAAWGHVMRLNEVDEPAIREFIDTFRGGGGDAPEANQDCPNEVDQPFAPQPTPVPGETLEIPPGEEGGKPEGKKGKN
jgi:uncharacterized protein DUF3105